MSINPRKYKERVTVEFINPDAAGDENGVVDETDDDNWIEFTSGYAAIHAKGGKEVWRAQQIHASATHAVEMPYSEKLSNATTQMRIDHEGHKLNIVDGPRDPEFMRRELRFVCEESK